MEARVRSLVAQLKQESSLKKIRKILNVKYDIQHNYGFHKTKKSIILDKLDQLFSEKQSEIYTDQVSEVLTRYLNADSMIYLLEASKTDSDGLIDACINLIEYANCCVEGQDLNEEDALIAEAAMAIMILHHEYSIPFDTFQGFA